MQSSVRWSTSVSAMALAMAIVSFACTTPPEDPQSVGRGPGVEGPAGQAGANADADALVRRAVHTGALASEEDFLAYSRQVGTERFTKFIVDVHTEEIHYFDVNIYRMHLDFILGELSGQWKTENAVLNVAAGLFNRWQVKQALETYDANYEADKPNFMLCALVHHTDQDLYTFTFWEGDKVRAADVRRARERMRETFFAGDRVRFRPNSTLQEELLGHPALDGVETITNDKIYKAAPYRAFSIGSAVGRLRIDRGGDWRELDFGRDEIVILTRMLPDITPVRGVITEQFSSPLSHVALRARAWGVPHVRMKGAADAYASLEGKWVVFEANAESGGLREATEAELVAEKARLESKRTVRLPDADLEERRIKPLVEIRAAEAGAYGAKTANLGEIAAADLEGFAVPGGFGIPIVYYAEHLERAGLGARPGRLTSNERFQTDGEYRRQVLEGLRHEIMAAPIDERLMKRISEQLEKLSPEGKDAAVFVRSSTNAEDLPGFNGAGLYDTVPNVRGPVAVAEAVKKVWASVWNKRAYEERDHFGVDHSRVYGAVLVQAGVDATAAGVLITANIFDRQDRDSYTINAKSGLGLRVVEGRKVPEQLLFDTSNQGIKVLSRSDEETMLVFDPDGGVREVSNPNQGQPVLTDERTIRLAAGAQALKKLFGGSNALDIEWLFEDDQLHIVQSRPYIGG